MSEHTDEPVVDLLDEEWTSIAELASTLTEAEWKTPVALEGWTVQDCVSHVIGIEATLLGDPMPAADVSHLPYLQSPAQEIVEIPIEHRRSWPGSKVLEEYGPLVERRLDHLRSMTTEDFGQIGWSPLGEVPYRDFMVLRVFDCWMHEQDMRRALRRTGHLSGRVVDTALERFRAAMPYVVGKKAAAPEGSITVLRTTGPTALVWTIEVVDKRAKLTSEDEDGVPADPTVTVTMPFESFIALGGGRWSVADARAAGGLSVDGDTELGERILVNLAFTP